MMRYKTARNAKHTVTTVLTGAIMLIAASAAADDLADKGRKIADKQQSSVVTVRIVSKTMGRESKSEVTGTIIDSSGLIVASLFSMDPTQLWQQISSAMGEAMAGFKMESEITDVKVRMSDGKELAAKIVLRDKDLDLAFVRTVEKPAKPLPAIDLSATGKVQLLDHIVVLNRLGRIANWAPCAYIDRIHAIIEKPRTLYVPGGMGALESELGCPVFALDGKAVGILVLRAQPSEGSSMGSMFGGMSGMGMLPVILPSEDILEVAKQAPKTAE